MVEVHVVLDCDEIGAVDGLGRSAASWATDFCLHLDRLDLVVPAHRRYQKKLPSQDDCKYSFTCVGREQRKQHLCFKGKEEENRGRETHEGRGAEARIAARICATAGDRAQLWYIPEHRWLADKSAVCQHGRFHHESSRLKKSTLVVFVTSHERRRSRNGCEQPLCSQAMYWASLILWLLHACSSRTCVTFASRASSSLSGPRAGSRSQPVRYRSQQASSTHTRQTSRLQCSCTISRRATV